MSKRKKPTKNPTLKATAKHYAAAEKTFMLNLYRRAIVTPDAEDRRKEK